MILLQHPRERDVPIGTARIAHLSLPNSELHVGVHWDGVPALEAALSDPERPAVLLYPGEGAVDVLRSPPSHPVTLVVVDGTWANTRTLVRDNPRLASLPRFAFAPDRPSEYQIRREPAPECTSTIEALAHVLGALEGDRERFDALLVPFRAMVATQLDYAARREGGGRRHLRRERQEPTVPTLLRERASHLLCVVGEANAWPYSRPAGTQQYPDELVHWVAHRPATGECFEAVIAPRQPLAPRTSDHLRMDDSVLMAGSTLSEAQQRWRDFARPEDLLCSWGHYATSLFVGEGGWLPADRLDLRQVARQLSRGKVGTLEEYLSQLDAPHSPPMGAGRAGARLAGIATVAQSFLSRDCG